MRTRADNDGSLLRGPGRLPSEESCNPEGTQGGERQAPASQHGAFLMTRASPFYSTRLTYSFAAPRAVVFALMVTHREV